MTEMEQKTEYTEESQGTQMKPGSFNLTNDKSLVEFGKLVKTWSKEPENRPTNLAEFEKQLIAKNIQYELSGDIENIRLIDREENVFSILLPLASRLRSSEKDVKYSNGSKQPSTEQYSYPLPRGYARLRINTEVEPAQIEGMWGCDWDSFNGYEELDDFRVGDYCSSQCA